MNRLEWHILVMLNWMCAVTIFGSYMSMYDCFDDVVETQGIWRRKMEEFEKLVDNSLAIMKGEENYVKQIPHVPFNVIPENTVIHQCNENDANQTVLTPQHFERPQFQPKYNLPSFVHMVYEDVVWLFYSDCYGNIMFVEAVISSPLTILIFLELFLASLINALLVFIIYKYTPVKMKDYRLILLTMAASQLLIGVCGLGCTPEYLYPLPVLRISGYFQYLGKTFGGHLSLISVVFFYTIGGMCITECSLLRYYSLAHRKYHLKTSYYLIVHFIFGIIVIPLGTLISKYFLNTQQGLIEYAKIHAYSLNKIDLENDVLVIANVVSSFFLPIFIIMISLILAIPIINYVLNFFTHRHMKRYFSIVQISSVQYQQQRRMTMLLIGQGSLPLVIPALVALILASSFKEMFEGKAPPKFVWDLGVCTVTSYAVFSPILTVVLTKPYYMALLLFWKKITFKNEISVSVVKF